MAEGASIDDGGTAQQQHRAEPELQPERAKKEPAFYQRRKKRGNEICQILIRDGAVTPDQVRKALRVQEEQGGQIGRILVRMGACDDRAIARALLKQLQEQREKGATNISFAARENPGLAGLKVDCSPVLTVLALVVSDLFSLLLAAGICELLSYQHRGWLGNDSVALALAGIGLCLVGFAAQGMYAAMSPSPPDEIANSTKMISLIFVAGAAITLIFQRGMHVWAYRAVFAWWFASVFFVPVFRAILRMKVARKRWWGHPVVVLGAGQTGRTLVRILMSQPERGLKPVMMLDDDKSKHGTLRANLKEDSIDVRSTTQATDALVTDEMRRLAADILSDAPPPGSSTSGSTRPIAAVSAPAAARSQPPPSMSASSRSPRQPEAAMSRRWGTSTKPRGMFAEVESVPVVGEFALAPVLAKRLAIRYAILAMPGVSSQKLLTLTERVGGVFSHLLLIPDLLGFASLGVPAKDVGGILGIEVRQQLLLPWPRFAKRMMDLAATIVGGVFIFPIIGLLMLLIKIDSPGKVFYFQERLGRDGTRFRAAKFRSMYGDGEARLKAVLEKDEKLRAEYEEFHKLTNDPRVTRVGKIVRKFSLDELPQLWNVLKGEMSLVGPRPYLEREIPDMEQREGIILRAPPGMTGLWQVSDRNATGFAQRVKMDVHYVRNWSPWLDIYILARTVGVVLKGTGV